MSKNPGMVKIENRKNPGFWPSLSPRDLIWVTLGQDTYCMHLEHVLPFLELVKDMQAAKKAAKAKQSKL